MVSLAVFRVERDLKIVDCTKDVNWQRIYLEGEPSAAERDRAVWSSIARAFREPVSRDDDVAEYSPTQIIAELFKSKGFDGVAYRSAFGEDRFNVALFDLNAATLVTCSLVEIKGVDLEFKETANPYFVRTTESGEKERVRNVATSFMPLDSSPKKVV